MLSGELAGEVQHPPTVKRHTGFQCQVVAQHGAHTDRIAVVVGDAEVKDGATGTGGFDRVR